MEGEGEGEGEGKIIVKWSLSSDGVGVGVGVGVVGFLQRESVNSCTSTVYLCCGIGSEANICFHCHNCLCLA